MNEAILVALLSFAGTTIGSIFSVMASNRVMSTKIEALEREVNKHNKVIERTYRLEEHAAVLDVQFGEMQRRIVAVEKTIGGA